jgi:hypothetical protein
MTEQNYPPKKCNLFNKLSEKLFVTNRYRLALLFRLSLIIAVLFPFTANAQAGNQSINKDWVGSYYFSETAQSSKRRSSGDVVPSVSYDITVEEKNDKLVASFSASGVQLFEAYNCSVVVENDKLEFYFQSLSSPDMQNFRQFKKGDLLFSLSKTKTLKTTKYLFQPAAYKIIRVTPAKQKTSVYFEKPDAPLSSILTLDGQSNLLTNYQINL